MQHSSPSGNLDALTAAQETIARQASEIDRLQRQLNENRFAEELRNVLRLAMTAGTIVSPITHGRLLELIVETATQVIASQAAALFLIDEEAEELIFEVALGQKAAEVKKFRVPLGHGIAGLVAVTGQPMAISDAQSDPRQAADIARSVGYVPKSILCVPLFYNDQITGVLELLDKTGGRSFTPADMTALGLFANLAAVAIEQSRTQQSVTGLLGEVLGAVAATSPVQPALAQGGREFANALEADLTYREALDLAQLVQEIAAYGEHERDACSTILAGFVGYLRSRPALDYPHETRR